MKMSQDITSVIPQGNEFRELNELVTNRGLNNNLVFKIKSNLDFRDAGQIATQLENDLAENFDDCLVPNPDGLEVAQKITQYTFENYPVLLDSQKICTWAKSRLDTTFYLEQLQQLKIKMSSFGGGFLDNFYAYDPLGIANPLLEDLGSFNKDNEMFFEDGRLFSAHDSAAILYFETTFDGTNTDLAVALKQKLDSLTQSYETSSSQLEITYFSPFVIAAENNIIIQKDTRLVTTISVVFILALLFFIFRNFFTPILFALPILGGVLFAFAIIGYLDIEISGISLATSAVVLGIVLDYSFHYFTHLKSIRDPFETIFEIAVPLLTGSLTTILAFVALLFVNSKVLNDFGLITSLTLLGAAIFVITTLPLIISFTGFKFRESKTSKEASGFFSRLVPGKKVRTLVFWSIILVTIFLANYSGKIQFNGDLSSISYQPTELVELEKGLTGLDPQKDQKVYLFAKSKDLDSLGQTLLSCENLLQELESDSLIKSHIGVSSYILPQSIIDSRTALWQKQINTVFDRPLFNELADSIGFDTTYFDPFFQHQDNAFSTHSGLEALSHTPYKKFYYENNGEHFATFILVTDKAHLQAVTQQLQTIEGIDSFNRLSLASAIISQIKDDFNYILITTSSIVFLVLLLLYGRIEITLITFIPMVISWIWILGLAAIFNIEFNFVNIVLTTFIFGLGDDFSIFITDGLLTKYKTGKNTLDTNNQAINLSALTTVAGTGALFFAVHPAIHSISLVSVLGIVCILFVSKFVQPFLFNFFIFNRVKKGLPPLSVFDLFISVFVFGYFLAGCIVLNLFLLPLLITPINKVKKRSILNFWIHWFVKSMLWVGFNTTKKTEGKALLDKNNPVLFIANHSSFLDILLVIAMSPKTVIMVKDWVYHSPFFGAFVRYAGYVYNGGKPETTLQLLKERIAEGYSVVIFPEGTRSADGHLRRFHKGAFLAAQQLDVDIQPIIINGASWCMPKNDFILQKGVLHIKVLPRINKNNPEFGITYQERTKKISKYYRQEFEKVKHSIYFQRNVKHAIQKNYLYKGPVLEWYFRVKWQFEKDNYRDYASRIGEGNILDLGCGYGYLSFYLSRVFKNSEIRGIDYDHLKIEIAESCTWYFPTTQFESNDLLSVEFKKTYQYIFLNDVLHYFSRTNQQILLQKLTTILEDGGKLIIRDGVNDSSSSHNKTLMSEFFSTNLGFNKKTDQFYFPTLEEYHEIAQQFNCNLEMVPQGNKLSNQLFIYQKKKD